MDTTPAPRSESSLLDPLLRLTWMAVGPGAVAVLLTTIVTTGRWFDGRNLALAVCILAIVAVRWLEFSRGNSRTADDEPTTQTHAVRFTLLWMLCGLVAWAAANSVAHFTRMGG